MRGFSLIETLVALVVLSSGLLGIAALYLEGLRGTRSAIYHSHAINLAADMAESIRANRNAGVSGSAYALASDNPPLMQGCLAAGLSCTATALAQEDLARWLVAIRDSLPGDGHLTPSGIVAVDTGTTPTTYTITVMWAEPGAEQPLSYAMRIQA